jgi:hypothetical protein
MRHFELLFINCLGVSMSQDFTYPSLHFSKSNFY